MTKDPCGSCNSIDYHGAKLKYIDGKANWICEDCLGYRIKSPEFVPDSVKEERKENFKSLLQPFRNGELSREYVEAHGTKSINVSDTEVKKAKYQWKDIPGWSNREKSK